MKTLFPKKEAHIPKCFVIDANGKTLGRLATEVSKLLRGKETSYFTPGVDQGNFVIVANAKKILVTGNKEMQKLYYRNSQTPGNLKVETFKELRNRIPVRIVEKSIWGMLPKGVLGRTYYRRLYVYQGTSINLKKPTKLPTSNYKTLDKLDYTKRFQISLPSNPMTTLWHVGFVETTPHLLSFTNSLINTLQTSNSNSTSD